MRYWTLTIISVVAIIAGLVIASWKIEFNTTGPGSLPEIVLSNLPATYCPDKAEIFHTSDQSQSKILPVIDCRRVSLKTLDLAVDETVYLKLPHAISLSFRYGGQQDRINVAPRIGDANNDNTIDGLDELAVLSEMFTDNFSSDVTMDRKVSSEDLALTKINQGVGRDRPDDGDWTL